MKKYLPIMLISVFFISCGRKELQKEEAIKLINQYYELPYQTKIAIDVIYDNYGWPPEKYRVLVNQGLFTLYERGGSIFYKRYQAIATEEARQYWIQNGTAQTNDGKVYFQIFKGYQVDLQEISVSSNAKENRAEAEVILKLSNVSPFQNVFSPLKQTEIKKGLNFKLFDDGWKIVEDENSKKLFDRLIAPLHWAERLQIQFDNTPLSVANSDEKISSNDQGGDSDEPINQENFEKLKKASNSNTVSTSTPGSFNGKYPQASQRLLTANDISGLSKSELKIMRNEIFARHGYIFKTTDMQNYFAKQSWYKGQNNDVNSMLSNIEKLNIDFIKKHE